MRKIGAGNAKTKKTNGQLAPQPTSSEPFDWEALEYSSDFSVLSTSSGNIFPDDQVRVVYL